MSNSLSASCFFSHHSCKLLTRRRPKAQTADRSHWSDEHCWLNPSQTPLQGCRTQSALAWFGFDSDSIDAIQRSLVRCEQHRYWASCPVAPCSHFWFWGSDKRPASTPPLICPPRAVGEHPLAFRPGSRVTLKFQTVSLHRTALAYNSKCYICRTYTMRLKMPGLAWYDCSVDCTAHAESSSECCYFCKWKYSSTMDSSKNITYVFI